MVTGRLKRGAGWRHLVEAAGSADKESRLVALIRAYAWVEHALDAAEASGPRRPIARRILRTFDTATLSRGLSEGAVRRAISIRHAGSHEDTVPTGPVCMDAVTTLRDVWHALSRHFVNIETAAALARDTFNREGILAVCLYGSLARAAPEPNDIDFLVLDDGRYSSEIDLGQYDEGTFSAVRTTREALEMLGVLSPKLQRCTECRWLDLSVIDGKLFGADASYTSKLRMAQPDPWFYVNISRDLKEFDLRSAGFKPADRFPFRELKLSQADLARLGFV